MRLPALVVTPHSSAQVPAEVLALMLGQRFYDHEAREERLEWLFRESDPYTDVLFHTPEAHNLHAPVSRFVVDLNRGREEGGDNGVLKLTDFEKRLLYPAGFILSELDREERLRRYWDSFHHEIEQVLEVNEIRLLVNGHSMQPSGPAIGPDVGKPRPAVGLMAGTDSEGTPFEGYPSLPKALALDVLSLAHKHFAPLLRGQISEAIRLGEPWKSDQLSQRYSNPARARPVPGFGLEFNRALYLTYEDGKECPDDAMIRVLNAAFRAFLAEVMELV
ncbi:MAG: glutamine synthetase catalytic region [Armatimonadota bacterium]